MARAFPQSDQHDPYAQATGEWADLKTDLMALLDQVETQVVRTAPPQVGFDDIAERMRDLRHQVTETVPESRHRDALRSVQRAIDRYGERAEAPPSPRDNLESAIRQIRARQGEARSAAPQPRPAPQPAAEPPRFAQMAEAVGGLSGRLERLEAELKAQSRGQSANVKEIADQVGQLSHVVELLAGAVGETGQVKRLEAQIAGLARLVAEGPQIDLGALTGRLDALSETMALLAEQQQRRNSERDAADAMTQRLEQVAATVDRLAGLQQAKRTDDAGLAERLEDVGERIGRLADLQRGQTERLDRMGIGDRLDDVTATVGRLADLQVQVANRIDRPRDGLIEGMVAIEEGIRGVYDRIDAIERSVALAPAELDKITSELANFTAAMRNPQNQPQGLVEMLDVLNVRISDIESRSEAVSGLKDDVAALRGTLLEAMEPRFAVLEKQIETLADHVVNRVPEPGLGQIEAQVRQLVARMDQTGEQLSGLARLYTAPSEREPLPDLGALADMVAQRTSDALATARIAPSASTGAGSDDMSALQVTIREVNDRLQRLESVLAREPEAANPERVRADHASADALREAVAQAIASLSERTAPKPQAQRPAPSRTPDPEPDTDALQPLISAFERDGLLDDVPPATPDARSGLPAWDAMPASPAVDAPLKDRPFAPAQPELPETPRRRHAGVSTAAAEPISAPRFDRNAVERPPQPRSSLDQPAPERFPATAAPGEAKLADAATPSRNTFIEAHRRAARLSQAGKPQTVDSGSSLISRALARFQETSQPAEPAPVPPPTATGRTAKLGTGRKLAGDKPLPEKPRKTAEPVTENAEAVAQPTEEGVALLAGGESFIVKHRRALLLGAAVVVLLALTANFIGQRLSSEAPLPGTAEAAATPAVTAPLTGDATLAPIPMAQQNVETAAPAPRMIPIIDTLTTGAIGAGTPRGFTPATDAALPQAFARVPEPVDAPPTDAVAALSDAISVQPLPLESPVQVELPPEAVGPLALRQSAAAGDARAQFEVAAIYTEGRAVAEDLKVAAVWYERSAAQGFAPAQYRLGSLYENGEGVDKDLTQARLWYQRAAEAGNRMAMHNLAALYAGGGLGKQEFEAAAKWFEEAASRGMKDSQFNLGMLYARGLGVTQSFAESYKWFSLAATKGDTDAAKARDDIAASLDPATMRKVSAEISAWKERPIDLVANFAPIGTWNTAFDPGAAIAKREVVLDVQKALMQLGYDIGTPDGLAGRKTSDAIRDFERKTGMSESGEINPRLLAVLGSQPV